jgi:anti-sigma factor RsiW
MNCSQTEILIHALLDNELDADHAIDVEAHLRTCAACSEELVAFDTTRKVVVAMVAAIVLASSLVMR